MDNLYVTCIVRQAKVFRALAHSNFAETTKNRSPWKQISFPVKINLAIFLIQDFFGFDTLLSYIDVFCKHAHSHRQWWTATIYLKTFL